MPIAINGSGTITGISVGGLENGCVNEADLANAAVTETKLASNAVTIDKLGTTLQSQVCKAWVNFNGTSTVAIRASYNVSSITDNAVGNYTVNLTTAMPDVNYSAVATIQNNPGVATGGENVIAMNTGSVRITAEQTNNFASYDPSFVCVAIFR